MAPAVNCLLYSILLLFLPISIVAQNYNNITLGSSLTANRQNSSWVSPSGEFAFGFQQIGTGDYLLAIWFSRIPERTIVWSANRDNPVREGSRVELTADGRFVLNDPQGDQSRQIANVPRVAHAAMLDSGCFVLAGNDSNILWESFDYPTDTILPAQTLSQDSRLIASFSNTNYSSGRFEFSMQTDGNLVLYTRTFPLDAVYGAYWASNTVGSGFQVVFNQSGYVYLTARNGSILYTVFSNGASTSQFYQRVVLDYDGVLRQYVYPKSAGSANGLPLAWSIWSPFPDSDICMIGPQDTGGGACGFNSYCSPGTTNQRPKCECPYGYTHINPDDELGGCKPSFVPQNCDEETQETDLFDLIDMPNTNWPTGDYEHFERVTEDWCRQACLGDCFCAVAIFGSSGCWKKKYPLSNGRTGSHVTDSKALIKIRRDNTTVIDRSGSGVGGSKSKHHSVLFITGVVLLGSSIFLLLLSAFFAASHLNNKRIRKVQTNRVDPTGANLRIFTYNELEEATHGFKEEIGKGAFSTVYKGALKHENGKLVAIKKLDRIVKGEEREFKAEMSSISRTNHKNLVQLLGYCNEGQHRLLVYEFMSNGSLASLLFENPRPNWYKRIQIAFGIARGLNYLHEECSAQIIHCDIKPQNILLDEYLTARISDFGLAKLLRKDQSQTMTGVRGTKGYVAPEWFKNKPITVKVDVYSFGILLLEIICCRRSIEMGVESEDEMILSDWAYDCYRAGKLLLLVADEEEAMEDYKRVEKFVMVAIWCIQEDPSLRPTMKKVTQMLEGAVEVPVPPEPYSFVSSI